MRLLEKMENQENKIKEYLKQPYARVLIPEEDGGFSARILEFPGCFAEGDTANEAIANLEEVAGAWIEAAIDQGHDIPAPSANEKYSGRFALRLPREVHRMAAAKAARDGVSLNACLVTAVAAWVGADNLTERLIGRVCEKWTRHIDTWTYLVWHGHAQPEFTGHQFVATTAAEIGNPFWEVHERAGASEWRK